jgi:type II pantothenate kinase
MLAAFDFGISNTDIGIYHNNTTQFFSAPTPKKVLDAELVKNLLTLNKIDLSAITCIGVTGGKSSNIQGPINSIPVVVINEIEAIGQGAKILYNINTESTLVISAGTGTACVQVTGDSFNHLGGIAVGGGMLEGLGSLLFKNSNGYEINEFGKKGSRAELDLLIGDVVNTIGNLSPDITAVNFGKARYPAVDTMENTSSALCNMIGEVIGTVAYLNALLIGSSKACFIGRTSYLSEVVEGINQRLDLAGVNSEYADNREYGNVIGVLESIKSYR